MFCLSPLLVFSSRFNELNKQDNRYILITGLVSMPLYTAYLVLGRWPLPSVICDIWLSLDYTVSNASVANLVIICFDRSVYISQICMQCGVAPCLCYSGNEFATDTVSFENQESELSGNLALSIPCQSAHKLEARNSSKVFSFGELRVAPNDIDSQFKIGVLILIK